MSQSAPPSRPRKYRIIAGGLLIAALAAVVWSPAGQILFHGAHDKTCQQRLRQIGLALQAYHEHYGSFPPAYVLGPNGKRWHSWRVSLLPFLGERQLYDQYRFDEPWNGPHNAALHSRMPSVYASPANPRAGVASFLAIVGPATVWPEQYCIKISEIYDGTSNTVSLVEDSTSAIRWLEPQDLNIREVTNRPAPVADWASNTDGFRHKKASHFLLADGTVKTISPEINKRILQKIISASSGARLRGAAWPIEHLSEEEPLTNPVPSENIPNTDIVPYTETPLATGRNCVYCATFAIAWDMTCELFEGRPLHLEGDPPLAQGLNAHRFDRRNLSPNSYTAVAGVDVPEFADALAEEVHRKFPDGSPQLLGHTPHDDELIRFKIYAYLLKKLPFQYKFHIRDLPLMFQGESRVIPVASFDPETSSDNPSRSEILSQVTVLDYVSDDDFVLKVGSGIGRDEIVLAKVQPDATLQQTVDAVQKRIATPNSAHKRPQIEFNESLVIPRLTFSVTRDFNELVGRDLQLESLKPPHFRRIDSAVQIIKFRLDHAGGYLESEADIGVIGDDGGDLAPPPPPPPPRHFLLDRPFLIYLSESKAPQPYFAAWIANAEFMTMVEK